MRILRYSGQFQAPILRLPGTALAPTGLFSESVPLLTVTGSVNGAVGRRDREDQSEQVSHNRDNEMIIGLSVAQLHRTARADPSTRPASMRAGTPTIARMSPAR